MSFNIFLDGAVVEGIYPVTKNKESAVTHEILTTVRDEQGNVTGSKRSETVEVVIGYISLPIAINPESLLVDISPYSAYEHYEVSVIKGPLTVAGRLLSKVDNIVVVECLSKCDTVCQPSKEEVVAVTVPVSAAELLVVAAVPPPLPKTILIRDYDMICYSKSEYRLEGILGTEHSVTYETPAIRWKMNYNALLNDDNDKIKNLVLSRTATIYNETDEILRGIVWLYCGYLDCKEAVPTYLQFQAPSIIRLGITTFKLPNDILIPLERRVIHNVNTNINTRGYCGKLIDPISCDSECIELCILGGLVRLQGKNVQITTDIDANNSIKSKMAPKTTPKVDTLHIDFLEPGCYSLRYTTSERIKEIFGSTISTPRDNIPTKFSKLDCTYSWDYKVAVAPARYICTIIYE